MLKKQNTNLPLMNIRLHINMDENDIDRYCVLKDTLCSKLNQILKQTILI